MEHSLTAPTSADNRTPHVQSLSNSAAIDLTEFKLGWRILILAMLGVAINANASMLYAFGSLVIPLQNAFGWTRPELQSSIAFLFAGAVVGSQLVGWLNHRFGLRAVTFASLAALSAVYASLTLMGASIAWLYLGFVLLPIASMGTMQVTWTQIVNLWFERNRGLALSIILSGTGLAAALLPPAVTWGVENWGWQAAFAILAVPPVLLVLPLALVWMHTPAVSGMPSGTSAAVHRPGATGLSFGAGMRSTKFWIINAGLILVVAAVVAMVTNIVPLLRDKGLSAADASRVFSSFGASLILGRIFVGYLIDRVWAPGVAAVALALPAIGCLVFLSAAPEQIVLLVLATFLVGIGAGAEFDISAFLVARYFGMRDYGRIFGVHLGLITAGTAVAPLLFGALYKMTGAYSGMLIVTTGCFLVGPLLLLALGRYPKLA